MGQTKVMVNGVQMGFGHVVVNMLGTILTDFTEIEYSKKQEKTNTYGGGNAPSGRGHGKIEYEASITLSNKTIQQIYASLPAGMSLVDIPPFPITVSFVSTSYKPVIHKLHYVEFTDEGVATKQGDVKAEHKCKLIVGSIDFN